MKAETKKTINDYLDAIGGIESIEKSERMNYYKAVIQLQNDLDANGMRNKIQSLFPFSIMTKKAFNKLHKK